MGTTDDPNVGVAFALVIGAGAATALGASVVFFPSLVKLASRRVLAGALGISAGVMTYVSFVEIFQKSVDSFLDADFSEKMAQIYATVCFFGGVVFMLIIDFVVKCLSKGRHVHSHDHPADQGICMDDHDHEGGTHDILAPHCVCCADDPVGELEDWKKMAGVQEGESKEVPYEHKLEEDVENVVPEENNDMVSHTSVEQGESTHLAEGVKPVESGSEDESFGEKKKALTSEELEAKEQNRKLVRMGINTAVAIGLHNFPEGLATFVAALDDPKVGAVLAIAIGIHNIPEGLCVSLPIYYATGNRWKAFGWACVSGLSEPIAALLGWAVLANSFSNELYAILFGLVAGMMVIISTRELLPTAHRYDPEDTVVTYSFIGGMAIMALSLVLFLL